MGQDNGVAGSKRGSHGHQDTDLQGQCGGGGLPNCYNNPTLVSSTTSVVLHTDRESPAVFTGSSDFIVSDSKRRSTAIETVKSAIPWTKRKIQGSLTKKLLYKRLPFLNWVPTYNGSTAIGDLVAGISVGLTVIPQALAYANLATLPPQYGLYSSFLGCFAYIVLGTCKDVPFGPTAIQALMTAQAIKSAADGTQIEHAILMCFLSGVVMMAMGILGLGFLVDFISGPVSSGFTSAAALIIATSQVKDMLGVSASGTTFVNTWRSIFLDIHNTHAWDTVLGICCIAVLLIMRIIGTIKIGPQEKRTKFQECVNKFLWFIGTARNAIVVIICGGIGYSFVMNGEPPFKVIGYIQPGLPHFKLPPFGLTKTIVHNTTNGTEVTESIHFSFFDMLGHLGGSLIIVPLVALLETIAICKAFSYGKPVDATQELLAVGVCNVMNSFVGAFPGTGSLSRSAVSNASGSATPLSSLYAGILVIVSLLFLTPCFKYVPKASLAAVIIAAVVFMVEVRVVKPMWRTKKSDFFVGIVTFVASLVLPLEHGILVGVGINLLFILYHAARPKITVEKLKTSAGSEYLLLTPDRCLIFPSTDYVRNLVTKQSIRQGVPVVIDCSHIYGADYTAATVVETLTKDFSKRDQPLFFYNLKPSVSQVFEGLSPKDFVVFYNYEDIDDLLMNRACIKKQNDMIERV